MALGVARHVPGAESKVLRSFKGWLMAGGVPEVRRERRGDAHLRKQIAVLRQAVSFERYFKSKNGSCSGAPLEPVGRRIA